MVTNDNFNPEHVAWSRERFEMTADGGTWAIPRLGMIFVRRGERLVLVARMPHDPAMPISADELTEQQNSEFEDVRQHFKAAGIDVIDTTKPEGEA